MTSSSIMAPDVCIILCVTVWMASTTPMVQREAVGIPMVSSSVPTPTTNQQLQHTSSPNTHTSLRVTGRPDRGRLVGGERNS